MQGEKEKKLGTHKQLQEGKRCCKVTKLYMYSFGKQRHSVLVVCYTKSSGWNGGDATTTHSSKEIYLG